MLPPGMTSEAGVPGAATREPPLSPPYTGIAAPLVTAASSETRKRTTRAISAGWTHFEWSASGCAARLAGVSITLGRIAFARIPCPVLGVEGLDEGQHRGLGGEYAAAPGTAGGRRWPTRRRTSPRPAPDPRHRGVREVEGGREVEAEHPVEVFPLVSCAGGPGEAADQVHHSLEVLDRGHRLVGAACRVDQVGPHDLARSPKSAWARSSSRSTIQVTRTRRSRRRAARGRPLRPAHRCHPQPGHPYAAG